jgi:hypothetical protein
VNEVGIDGMVLTPNSLPVLAEQLLQASRNLTIAVLAEQQQAAYAQIRYYTLSLGMASITLTGLGERKQAWDGTLRRAGKYAKISHYVASES